MSLETRLPSTRIAGTLATWIAPGLGIARSLQGSAPTGDLADRLVDAIKVGVERVSGAGYQPEGLVDCRCAP
jgi:hypothetical protein